MLSCPLPQHQEQSWGVVGELRMFENIRCGLEGNTTDGPHY